MTHVQVTPEMLERAAEWGKQPLPDSEEVVELKRVIQDQQEVIAELTAALAAREAAE